MKILVTGGSGQLGLALRAVSTQHDMVFTVSPWSGAVAPGDQMLDITDENAVDRLVSSARPDVIVHLAALVGGACDVDDAATRRVNVDSVEWICRASERHGVGRVVLASTAAVYGTDYSEPIDESAEAAGKSRYAQSKLSAEHILEVAATSTVALRIFNVFGASIAGSLVTRLTRSGEAGTVSLFGFDNFVRDYVHVADVADAIVLAASARIDQRHLVANIGSGIATSNRDLVNALERHWALDYSVTDGPANYSCADVSLAHRVLGFSAVRTFDDAAE